MKTIRVTVSMTLDYDPRDGIASTKAEAVADAKSYLNRGVSADQFMVRAEVVDE